MAPWSYTGDTDDAKSAFSKLVSSGLRDWGRGGGGGEGGY